MPRTDDIFGARHRRGSQLCEKCQKIDFDSYLSHRMGLGASTFRIASMKSQGKWSRFDRRTHCPFCRHNETNKNSHTKQKQPSSSATIRLANEMSWVLS